MKKIPLLPRYFQWIGYLFVLFAILSLIFKNTFEQYFSNVGSFVFISDELLQKPLYFQWMKVDFTMTFILIMLLLGLTFQAFARKKIEDEFINYIRLYSWTWSIIIMVIISFLFTLFVFGTPFLYSMLTLQCLLLTYLIIFNFICFRLKRNLNDEK